ncbi:MAG: glycosyltransferase family 4 protein [Candidatus Falkowbacteria bacterium]|nr:glycosyltransferase family 4 protein [Candidatus Falkowbacteria bacterium]
MKTILAALEFPPAFGGVENYYQNLANFWPDEFIVLDNSENKLLSKNALTLKWLKGFFTILSTAKKAQPDWVIVGEILPIGTATYLASFFASFKYAVFLHGLDFSMATKSAWKKFITKKILKRAKLILCANSKTAELVNAFIGANSKVKIVNPGINPQLPLIRPELVSGLRNNYGLAGNKVLISIGRLVKRKGVSDVLAVLPEILLEQENIRYIIIGNGPEENNIKKLLADPALKSRVFLLSNVSEEEKWAWLELSDIFVLPTSEINGDYEGFGIVYLEANLFSKPVIATRSGGVADAVVDGLNGRLIEAGDAMALKQAIIELTNNRELCSKLGQQGKTRALKDFAWSDKVKTIYELLKENI